MANKLREKYPMLPTRKQAIEEIESNEVLKATFDSWEAHFQESFLNFVTGARGVKVLYDGFFKDIFDAEIYPERVESLIHAILGQEVHILNVLSTDNTRLGGDSLVDMDILLELEDHSLVNLEIQLSPYAFPGERAACYSADLLLRLYKKARMKKKKEEFSYRDVREVYTIVILGRSTEDYKKFPGTFVHSFEQTSNSGLELSLLQKYFFIPLDKFLRAMHNKKVRERLRAENSDLYAWLLFLSSDKPKDILELIKEHPDFKAMYDQIYNICQNMEDAMSFFSKELAIMDRNTTKIMVRDMTQKIDDMTQTINGMTQTIDDMERKAKSDALENQQLRQRNEELERQLEQYKHGNHVS